MDELLEKLQELKVELAFQHGSSLHDCKACCLLREITGDDGTMEGLKGKLLGTESMPDLTPEEALEKARKRWGEHADVEFIGTIIPNYRVGIYHPPTDYFSIKGQGSSFREAFAKADEAKEKDSQ